MGRGAGNLRSGPNSALNSPQTRPQRSVPTLPPVPILLPVSPLLPVSTLLPAPPLRVPICSPMLRVTPQIAIPRSEFKFTFARSPGPGGQNVNKLNTKAILRWQLDESPSLPEPVKARFRARFPTRINLAGEVMITSHEHRDQSSNVAACLERLRDRKSVV